MTNSEKITELREEIKRLLKLDEKETFERLSLKYNLKNGDILEVKYVEEDDYEYNEPIWLKGEVYDLFTISNDDYVRVSFNGRYPNQYFPIKETKVYDENDYTLRHKIWNRLLEPGDKVKIINEDHKVFGTFNTIRTIEEINRKLDGNNRHFYKNDDDELIELLVGDYHMTHK